MFKETGRKRVKKEGKRVKEGNNKEKGEKSEKER